MNKTIKREGILLCVVGPAGSGKTTVGERLRREEGSALSQSVSVTSRSRRDGEVEGTHYHFVSRAEFDAMVRKGEFFEWEEIHGNCYGTPKKPIEETLKGLRDLMLIIDIRGALNVKRAFPKNCVIVFVTPSSRQELKSRMTARGGITEAELAKRLSTADSEYKALARDCSEAGNVDYLLINDDLESAVARLREMLYAERSRLKRCIASDVKRLCEQGD